MEWTDHLKWFWVKVIKLSVINFILFSLKKNQFHQIHLMLKRRYIFFEWMLRYLQEWWILEQILFLVWLKIVQRKPETKLFFLYRKFSRENIIMKIFWMKFLPSLKTFFENLDENLNIEWFHFVIEDSCFDYITYSFIFIYLLKLRDTHRQ